MNADSCAVGAPVVSDMFFETSDQIDAFAKAFPKAQAAMGDVLKKATNPAFKSKYADLSAVVEAVLPPLNENGFSVLQPPGVTMDGKVKVMTLFLHESGQWMRCTLTLTPTKSDPQGAGSAITYGRRYGLQAMSGVAPEDDDGNAASRPNDQPARKPDASALTTAAKAAINICDTMAALDAWRVNNAEFMAKLGEDNSDAHDDIVKHWKTAAKVIKARTPDSAKAAFPGDFSDAADEAADSLGRAA